jgi:hypothetical protein
VTFDFDGLVFEKVTERVVVIARNILVKEHIRVIIRIEAHRLVLRGEETDFAARGR